MPRQARERDLFGLYHVSQVAPDNLAIFNSDDQREIFVETLHQVLQQYPCDLLAYCMISPQQYHLILRFKGCDISQFMSSLNIRYTSAIGESGIFRDRYHSELLQSEEQVSDLLDRLETRATDAEEWNSFCKLDLIRGRAERLGVSLDTPDLSRPADTHLITSPAALDRWLAQQLEDADRVPADLQTDLTLRNHLICDARRASTLTQRQIGDVFGGLTESTISKILKQGVTHV